MKDNEKAKFINELREVSINFHNFQCLREKLIGTVSKFMGKDWSIDTSYSLEGLIEDVKLRDTHIAKLEEYIEELKCCSNCKYNLMQMQNCPCNECVEFSNWKNKNG